jgi:outer membrane receptor protein involved in Fe transport
MVYELFKLVPISAALWSLSAWGGGVQTLETVEVVDSAENPIGMADAASQGTVGAKQIENRPLLRPGELLEAVPGVIVTQHSGDGKANQYFLRGFNLDHGTDLAVTVAGMPVNMPTHGHGQGYADLNFLIPELVSRLQYKKGPYYADEGDFSAAGAVRIDYAESLKAGIAELSGGTDGYRRLLAADSVRAGEGRLLYAAEYFHNDGPWEVPEHYRRLNAVLRYSQGDAANGFNLTGMAYQGKWDSTDQVPQRAMDSGLIGRYGSLDPTDGGDTHRYSLSGEWRRSGANDVTRASAYAIDYRLNLFSNFTYYLDNPAQGDQFEQADERRVVGADLSHAWLGKLAGRDSEHLVGARFRRDAIRVGLYGTEGRQRWATTRDDRVKQSCFSLYYQNTTQWLEKFRSVAGLRGDFYRFDVDSSLAANSGRTSDHITSPKLSLIFGPWARTEYYLNLGYGFHSNDARGTVIALDPKTLAAADRVTPLVRARGTEIGLRSAIVPHLQSALSLWRLDIDSELLFVGDAGTTEPSRPSRRTGIEWANYWTPASWLTMDADLALSRARFSDNDPAGNRIPGAIEKTLSVGATVEDFRRYFGGLRLRYFGPRPLIEDDSVRSKSSTLVNARIGYKFDRRVKLALDVYNLFDREVSDIDYYYPSQLRGEGVPVWDVHSHPAEPRSWRLSLVLNY